MGWNLVTANTVYFGLSLVVAAFCVGRTIKMTGVSVVVMSIAFVANLLAMVGALPR